MILSSQNQFVADIAVIGAGIAGLAHAFEAARRGYKVVLFERDGYSHGASVRNFGAILPLGVRPGKCYQWALRSREVWLALAVKAGFWHQPSGALIAAYGEDELAVLAEFNQIASAWGYRCSLLDQNGLLNLAPSLNPADLQGGLWSQLEVIVDPREAIRKLPAYLTQTYGLIQRFNTVVTAVDLPYVQAGSETWRVERVVVCSGVDFQTLYPKVFKDSCLTRCKLQMMRTEPQPQAWRFGPLLATGFSLTHYPAFAACPSLPVLKARLIADFPEFERWGIHILAVQNGLGEVTLGDSHEYEPFPEPFDRPEIDDLIFDHLRKVLRLPRLRLSQRWHGIYAKHFEKDVVIESPAKDVRLVTGLGGAGMTLSFGLAQEIFDTW